MAEENDAAFMITWRERLKRKYRTYRAILILTNSLGTAERDAVERTLEHIDRVPTRQLKELAQKFEDAFDEAVRRYGLVAGLPDLEGLLEELNETVPLGNRGYACITKHELSKVFRHYERAMPDFSRWAPHARIGIDVNSFRESTKQMEVFQLEAFLFEDLASLWNETVRTCAIAAAADSSKRDVKLARSLVRATTKAAFNLLEGYLNGLACDILLTRTSSDEERQQLEEWNIAKARPRFLALRDKLLQYPRIAIGAQHLPLHEEMFPAMKRVLELELDVRHALIHPRPPIDAAARPQTQPREAVFFELTQERVATLCDDVVEVIEKAARVVGPDYGDVTLWLCHRDSNGLFPESSFD